MSDESRYDFKINVSEENNSHTKCINMIRDNKKILEFGCGNGFVSEYLRNVKNCEVYAVEYDEEFAKVAKDKCKEVLVGDIETLEWKEKFKDIEFDYVLCMDILEHIRNPKRILEEIYDFVGDNTEVIISVPNIANNAIIMELIDNNFKYSKSGLLDETHIYHFTYNTLCEIVKDAGFKLYEVDATYVPPALTEFMRQYNSKNIDLISKQYGSVYQFIAKIGKDSTRTTIDKIENANVSTYNMQIFYSDTNKYDEKESMLQPIKILGNVFECVFNIKDIKDEILNLRIDPINTYLFANRISVQLVYENGSCYNLNYNSMNGKLLKDGSIYFETPDPQLYYNLDNVDLTSANFIKVLIGFKEIDINSLERNTQLFKEVSTRDEYIINAEEVLKATEDYIINIEREIYNKDVHIGNLDNIIVSKDIEIENIILTKDTYITSLENTIVIKDTDIKNCEDELQNKYQQIEGLTQSWKNDIGILRKREERKYIIKYPARCVKKIGGFFIHPRATKDFYADKKYLKEVGVFDEQFYIDNSFDYKIHKYNALEHFMRYGWSAGKLPNAQYKYNANEYMYSQAYIQDKNMYNAIKSSKYFNDNYYKENNPDLPNDINAPWHFVEYGYKEGRRPSEDFDLDYYTKKNQDVANCGINPLYHYLQNGYYEGRPRKEGCEEKGAIYNLKVKRYRLKNSQHDMSYQNISRYIKKNGIKKSVEKAKQILKNDNNVIAIYNYAQPEKTSKVVNELKSFKIKPKISIIMPVYNVDPKWLDLAIKSVQDQWYENWELCLVDDCSTNKKTINYLNAINNDKIKVKVLEKNLNISGASNEALTMCTGEYIGLMDNDDEITVDALYEMVKKINDGFTFIYSDEDKLDMSNKYCEPHFKADFSRDLFNSQNYISHFTVIKKELINDVSGFTVGLEGSQDYDLYLKIFDICKDKVKIAHIPKVLYHWRKIPGSTASEFSEKSYAQDSGLKALQNSIERQGIKAKVQNGRTPGSYRVDYDIIGEPLVSIVIPFKDATELLTLSIGSVLERSTYKNFEIIGISNNSEKEETFAEMKRLEALDSRVKFYEYNVPFNYSDINNYAVNNYVKGEYVILLNNDIEILTENWIELMLGFAQRENTGAVGAKLYYPNDTIQHAGVIMGVRGLATHSHKHFSRDDYGYFARLCVVQNLSAVTGACLMVSTKKYKEINGLNEVDLKIAFNDVDFCLRLREQGYVNVFTPYVEAYHYESISRGEEDTPEKRARFDSEVSYMLERHKEMLEKGDPYYNKNLTIDDDNFALR